MNNYSITTVDSAIFKLYIEGGKVYKGSVYDFTFDEKFYIYHYKTSDGYVYVAYDIDTSRGSYITTSKEEIRPTRDFIGKILSSVKYLRDERYR